VTRHDSPPELFSDAGPEPLRGSVLCIEDHPMNMAWNEGLLAAFEGVTVLKAATGREGVRIALAEAPDLILLDMTLPDISGVEVVRLLCDELSSQRLTAVLVTADTFSMDVIKAMTLGAREYWMKPLTIQKLRKDLPRVLARAQADRARGAGA